MAVITLVVPSADTIGAFSPEVTAAQVADGIYESAIAGAVITALAQVLADLTGLSSSSGVAIVDAAGHFAGSDVETVTADLGARIHLAVADDAALQAVTATDRADGQIAVKLDTYDPWIFDADSVVGADAWAIVPTAGAGRWIRPWLSRTDLSTTGSATLGANLIGIRDAATLYIATTVEGALAEVKALADAAIALQKRTVTIGHADLTDAVNGEAQAINIGAVLPANAIVLAHEVNVATLFSGGGATAVKLDVGGTSATAVVNQMDVFTGAATGALSPRTGAHAQGSFSAEQLVATFTPDGAHTLLALDAGSLTVTVWFSILA